MQQGDLEPRAEASHGRPILTRVAFTSDLHVDHHPEVVDLVAARARESAADVLVVAGDVSPRDDRLADALRRLRDGAPRVAFVAGNHDLWCRDDASDSRARYLEVIPRLCAEAGVDCLHHAPVVLDGVTLAGQTGWYDFSLREEALDIPLEAYRRGRFGKLAWSDRRFIRWPGMADDAALTRWMADRLHRVVAAAPADRPLVVVTHMLAFDDLAPRRPLPWGFVRGFLGSSLLGETIAAAAKPIALAIAGHTHFARRAVVTLGGQDVIAETAPIGYPREIARQAPDLATHVNARVRVVDIAAAAAAQPRAS